MDYYSLLKSGMDQKSLPYHEIQNGVMEIIQKGKNIDRIRIVVGFDDISGNRPWLKCFDLGHFEGDKFAEGLLACNNANKEYRWLRFYIDKDNDVTAAADAIVNEETILDEVIELIARMISIVDTLYPSFMKARWA